MGKPSASSMAGCATSANDFVPYSRSATSAASTMPGTSAGMRPATGTMPLSPFGSGRFDDFPGQQAAVAEELRRGQLGHGADAGDGVHLAVARAHQDGRFAAESEVGELGDGGGQHGGDSRVHGVAALVVNAHAGFGGEAAARRHRSAHAARRVARRPFLRGQ